MNSKQKVAGGNEFLDVRDILSNKLGVTYGASLADFGCGGAGFFVLQAAKIVGPEGKVYAVDILKKALDNVRSQAERMSINNVETIWSNIEIYGATKINDQSLDFGLLVNVLFQNDKYLDILKETSRMVVHGGKMLVIDWREGRFPMGPEPQAKLPKAKLLEMVSGLGLEPIEEFEAGKFHYGVVLEKR